MKACSLILLKTFLSQARVHVFRVGRFVATSEIVQTDLRTSPDPSSIWPAHFQ